MFQPGDGPGGWAGGYPRQELIKCPWEMEDEVTSTFPAKCFLCGADAVCTKTDGENRRFFRCPKCTDYEISVTAMSEHANDHFFKSFASKEAARVTDPTKIYEIVHGQSGIVTRRAEICGSA